MSQGTPIAMDLTALVCQFIAGQQPYFRSMWRLSSPEQASSIVQLVDELYVPRALSADDTREIVQAVVTIHKFLDALEDAGWSLDDDLESER